MKLKKFNLKNILRFFILTFCVSFSSSLVSAEEVKSCANYLTSEFQNESSKDSKYYLKSFFGDVNYKVINDRDLKAALEQIEIKLTDSPNDLFLLNTYWYISELLSSIKRNSVIKNRRLAIVKTLEKILGSSEDLIFRYHLAYYDLGNYEEAFRLIFKLTKEHPTNKLYLISKVRTHIELLEFANALNLAERLLDDSPDNLILLRLASEAATEYAKSTLGNTSYKLELKIALYQKAYKYLGVLLLNGQKLGRKFQAYYIQSMQGHKTKEKYQEALDYLNNSELSISESEALLFKARSYLGLRLLDEAEPIIRKLLSYSDKNRFYQSLQRWFEQLSQELDDSGTVIEDWDDMDIPDLN